MTTNFRFGRYDPPVPFSATDDEKYDAPIKETISINLDDYPLNTEVVRVELYWTGPALGSRTQILFIWKNDDTGQEIFRREDWFEKGWTWCNMRAWIGHKAAGEIDRPGNYSVWIGSPGLFDQLIPFIVTEAAPPEGPVTLESLQAEALSRRDEALSLIAQYGFPEVFDNVPWMNVFAGKVQAAGFTLFEDWTVSSAAPPPEEPEPAKILAVLRDIFFEGFTLPDALSRAGIISTTISNIFSSVVDFFTVNVSPLGEKPIRVMFIGGGTKLASIPGVAAESIDDIVISLTDDAADKIIEKAATNPDGLFARLSKLTKSQVDKLVNALYTRPKGKATVQYLTGTFASKGAATTPANTAIMNKLMEVFGAKTPLSLLGRILMIIIGADGIAVWLASDNIITGTTFPMNRLKTMVEEGTVTKADAIAEIDRIQEWKDYATNFVNTSTLVNPFLWLFRKLFMSNTELAQTNIDQIRSQVEGATPAPTEDKAKLTINSSPSGAKIYVDFIYKFETTNTMVLLDPGTHTITLKLDGHYDTSQDVDLAPAEEETITMTLTPLTEPQPGNGVPAEEVIIPLDPAETTYNAWKVTIKAIDSVTGNELFAAILINDVYVNKYTPYYFYFAPESSYNIKLRKQGYKQGEVTFVTKPLPTT
ncbi:MAG: PEGA domain-containing protein [Thermodesulfovibrionia bacterium]|nr:PEGA domain-containing protein [Thermodesulfovibrionia bacterium]